MKIVKAVKYIGPVDCDENYKVSYTCVLCGYKWKQHMYAIPPQYKKEGDFMCGNCIMSKDFKKVGDYWE